MPTPSFHEWLRSADEAPAAENLATLIASAGAAGVSINRLRGLCGLSPETLADVLRGLVMAGQVTVLKVNEEMVNRATG